MPAEKEISKFNKAIGMLASTAFWTLINSMCIALKFYYWIRTGSYVKIRETEKSQRKAEAAESEDGALQMSNQVTTKW